MCAVPVSPQVRLPPYDLDAETSVLGAILLDAAAITRVLDQLSPDDFYRENNGQIYRAAQNLFREGEPIDNVTLAAELSKLGVLEKVGGRAHLATLQESVPTAANVEHYARIVKDKAYKRKLISAGTHVTSLGYDEALDADEAVNAAQAHVYAISDDKVGTGLEHIYGLLKPAMDRIDAQMASGGGVIGIPSGFHDLDRMTNGFKAADLAIIAGRPSMGKALALDTPIPTPTGWATMGALRVGDQVFDELGRPCTVVFATQAMHERECFEVVFSDGEVIVADAEHRWITWDRSTRRAHDDRFPGAASYPPDWSTWSAAGGAGRRPLGPRRLWAASAAAVATRPLPSRTATGAREAITTVQVAATLRSGGEHNHAIPATGVLHYPTRPLAVDPYAVGRRLASGAVPSGLDEDEGIPTEYLLSDWQQRLAMIQGLVDGAGRVDEHGRYRFVTTKQRLAEGLVELLRSLGLVPRARRRTAAGSPPTHEVIVASSIPLARLPRKREAARHGWGREHASRSVVDVRRVASVPVRCIQVDSPSHLYLAGRACVPTHNTSFVLNVTLYAAVEQKKPVAIFSLEMSKEQLVERMLCEQARIDAQRLHRGTLSDVEYERLAGALGPLGDAPIFIDDSPTLDDLTMRLKARQARSREGIELIVLDYLQLMHGRSRDGDANRVQEVSAISRALKGIARELSIPVIAISQLSRAPEARPDKRPILSDLRESGSIEQDADIVMFLYRDDYYNREKSEKPGIAEVIVAKHRNGPTGMVELIFRKELTRFENMERRRPEVVGPE
jgi:replicative DNA helicase